jgi:hypothetical protein
MEDPYAWGLEHQVPAKKLAFHHVTKQIDVPPHEECKKDCSDSQRPQGETTKNLRVPLSEQLCNRKGSAMSYRQILVTAWPVRRRR